MLAVTKSPTIIVGAGPVGLALAIFLTRIGYNVIVFEKKSRWQIIHGNDDRSVNITLSLRGIQALKNLGAIENISEKSAKVSGRMYHTNGKSTYVPYTLIGDSNLISIKRKDLLRSLISAAQKEGVEIVFEHELVRIIANKNECIFCSGTNQITNNFEFLFGADGINSKVRELMGFHSVLNKHDFVYKKIDITKENAESLGLRGDAVNVITTSTDALLITLPNRDGDPSGLLHMEASLGSNRNSRSIDPNKIFPEFADSIDDFSQQFLSNRTGQFNSLICSQWSYRNILLLGDAAHAILPFYGQGTNIGLEDGLSFMALIGQNDLDIQRAIDIFQSSRKKSTDAVSTLSYQNLGNLSMHSDNSQYLTLKFLELFIERNFPGYHPEYFRVAFTHEPFDKILANSSIHQNALIEFIKRNDLKGTEFTPKILGMAYSHLEKYLRAS